MLKAIKKACMNGTALVTIASVSKHYALKMEDAYTRSKATAHAAAVRALAAAHNVTEDVASYAIADASVDYSEVEARAAAHYADGYGLNLVRDEAHYTK